MRGYGVVTTAVILAAAATAGLAAQQRPTLTPADYGRFESLGGAVLSPDGAWIAYRVTRVNEENELRYRRLDDDSTHVAAWGRAPRFSPDGRWLMWTVEPSADERERLREADEPVRTDLVVRELTTGEQRSYASVRAASFDASGQYVALHGYAPEEPRGKGADLRVLELAVGTLTTFGNVSEYAWSDRNGLLAMAIATGADEGNGVQSYDAPSGRLRSLDSSDSAYGRLAWRDDAADLLVLRSAGDAGDEGQARTLVAWRGLDAASHTRLELAADDGALPDGMEVVRHRAPAWSDDGRMVSLGLRPAEDGDEEGGRGSDADEADPGDPDPDAPPGEEGADSTAAESAADDEEAELPDLQLWHTGDVRVFWQQRVSDARDQQRSLLAVWHVDEGRVVQIGSDLVANAQLLHGWERALEDDSEPYGWGTMFGRPYHDVWLVDVDTGERDRVLERVRYEWPSAGGGYLVSYDGERYASLDLETRRRTDLTSSLPTGFVNREYDTPTDVLPPFAFAPRWLERDEGVLLADRHDVWRVALDGSGATRLTFGAADRVTHRPAFLPDDDEPGLDPAQPIYFTLWGEWSEKRGYARLMPGGTLDRLVFEDAMVAGLVRADSADVYAYRAMAWDDPPDYFVAGPDLQHARQATAINPFVADYAWSRSELVDFTSEQGRDLQMVLYYPADYQPGRPVPTIVYTYEMRSQSIHQWENPSERDYYNFAAWTQQGYAVLQPDIVYTWREPGVSALASVRAAVATAVDMGVTDPDAVGLIGHSWGGYQATYLPTRTDIFAASVAGAPLTDFVSFMGQVHWNSGGPELSHWETGQGRMEVPFWEDPEAHRRNSPIHEVHNMETPLLMAFGDDDGTVDWDQGIEFYNFARRAGKQMVLLVYEGENHGFSSEPNQKDYHRRILEWFGHYLKGEPAASWITEGVPYAELEDEKKRVARKR